MGSAVQAVTGDINIEGDNVNIVSAVADSDFHNRFEYEKTGITVSVSSGVIDPLNTAYTYANIAKMLFDQLQTMAGAKAGLELNKAYENMPNYSNLKTARENIAKVNNNPAHKENLNSANEFKESGAQGPMTAEQSQATTDQNAADRGKQEQAKNEIKQRFDWHSEYVF